MEGKGSECSHIIQEHVFYTGFFWRKQPGPITNTIVEITRFECLDMILNHKCNGKRMNCQNNDNCYFIDVLPDKLYANWYAEKVHEL
jgi:hypothetical protein